MTSKVKNEVHIPLEKDEPLQMVELDQENRKQKLVTSIKDEEREAFLAKRSRNYTTIYNLTKKLRLDKKKEFSEFFQIKSGRYYGISYTDCLKRILFNIIF